MTVNEFKDLHLTHNPEASHCWSKATMHFFGDTMASFNCIYFNGRNILYRKPTAYITTDDNRRVMAGERYFGAWYLNEEYQMTLLDNVEKQELYDHVLTL